MKANSHHILQRFTEKAKKLLMLMPKNPVLQDLSDDYDVCVKAIRYWEQSNQPEAKERVEEYRAIASELEEEIAQQLKSKS